MAMSVICLSIVGVNPKFEACFKFVPCLKCAISPMPLDTNDLEPRCDFWVCYKNNGALRRRELSIGMLMWRKGILTIKKFIIMKIMNSKCKNIIL